MTNAPATQPTAAEVAKSLTTEEVAALNVLGNQIGSGWCNPTSAEQHRMYIRLCILDLCDKRKEQPAWRLSKLGVDVLAVLGALEPSATTDGQGLTDTQLSTLKAVNAIFPEWAQQPIASEETWHILHKLGLIWWDSFKHLTLITDSGRAYLEAASQISTAVSERPEVDQPSYITALQFDMNQFDGLIALGKCEVMYLGQLVRALSRRAEYATYMIWPLNDSEISGFIDPQDKMSVTWFAPQPGNKATEAGGDSDMPTVTISEYTYKDLCQIRRDMEEWRSDGMSPEETRHLPQYDKWLTYRNGAWEQRMAALSYPDWIKQEQVATIANQQARIGALLDVAKFFVQGYWTTVYIGTRANELIIHIPDSQLDEFRKIVSEASWQQAASGEGSAEG